MGSSEFIPGFALLVCMAFPSPIILSLPPPTSCLTSTLPLMSLVPLVGDLSKQLRGAWVQPGLNHNKETNAKDNLECLPKAVST